MKKFLVAAVAAILLVLSGPAVAGAASPERSPFDGARLAPATPSGSGPVELEQTVGPFVVLGVVAVKVILKQVVKKGARLRKGVRRVVTAAARKRLTAQTFRKLADDSRRFLNMGRSAVRLRWAGLSRETQGCIIGIANSKIGSIPTGGTVPEWGEYYLGINNELAKAREPFKDTPGVKLVDPVKLGIEFGNQSVAAIGACAAGAATGFAYTLPPGF